MLAICFLSLLNNLRIGRGFFNSSCVKFCHEFDDELLGVLSQFWMFVSFSLSFYEHGGKFLWGINSLMVKVNERLCNTSCLTIALRNKCLTKSKECSFPQYTLIEVSIMLFTLGIIPYHPANIFGKFVLSWTFKIVYFYLCLFWIYVFFVEICEIVTRNWMFFKTHLELRNSDAVMTWHVKNFNNVISPNSITWTDERFEI